LLVALAGCGLSSSPDLAKPTEPVAELHSAPVQGALVKRQAMPAPMRMQESATLDYQSEPREQYANLPDNPVHRSPKRRSRPSASTSTPAATPT